MRSRLIPIAIALAVAFVATPARAANSFQIDWYSYNHPYSCLGPGLVTEGQPNFHVNTVPIPTYSDWNTLHTGPNGSFEMWFHAGFSGTLFRIGTNQIAMAVSTANDSDYCTVEDNTVRLKGPGVDRLLFQFSREGTAFEGQTDVSLSLREIDPHLADALAALKKAIDDARIKLRGAGLDADALADGLERLDALEALLDELLDRGWDQITVEELNQILSQYDDLMPGVRDALVQFLADLQRNIEELRAEIDRISEVFRQQVDQIDGVVSGAPGWDPGDPGGFGSVQPGSFPPIDVPDVLGSDPWSPNHDPYDDYADEVIATLQSTVSNGVVVDRLTFVTTYSAWRENMTTLEVILQARSTVSVAEWGAFLSAKTRVLGFLHQYMDAKGWLKDAPIPPALKELVDLLKDLDVAFRFKQRAEALQLELELYTDQLTERQKACLDYLLVFDQILRERIAQPAPEEEEDGFWDTARDIVDFAIELTPIGDALDLCRAVTGKEGCWTGRDLTTTERVLSGLGVVAGSGTAWKAAGNVVSGPVAGIVRRIGDVLDDIPKRRPQANIVQEIPHLGGARTYVHANGWKVRYDRRGFPDFGPYKYTGTLGKGKVTITYTGTRAGDFKAANIKAGFGNTATSQPAGWTWHHHQDTKTMILVREDVHAAYAHTGGIAVYKQVHGIADYP
jgi:hypothetical protein